MSKKTSLRQFLMKTGKFQKSWEAVKSIEEGKITIDGEVIKNPNYFFNPKKSLVMIDGEKSKRARKLYFVMNKPAGYVAQKSLKEKNIYELLDKLDLSKEEILSLFSVGRLDRDTEGLLIITNDGALSNLVLQPKSDIEKSYYVSLEKPINREEIKVIERGVRIKDEETEYKTLRSKIRMKNETEVFISVKEGKKRQVRKMFEAVGNKVMYLRRESIGGLILKNLKVGEIRQMQKEDIYKELLGKNP